MLAFCGFRRGVLGFGGLWAEFSFYNSPIFSVRQSGPMIL